MMDWVELYEAHQATRRVSSQWSRQIRRLLTDLARAGHCDRGITSRFTRKVNSSTKLREWFIRPNNSGSTFEPLFNVGGLRDVGLALLALENTAGDHVHMFTASVQGFRRDPPGELYHLTVHLEHDGLPSSPTHDQRGRGACSHAALHCHVGPWDRRPAVRIPLPPLGPVQIVQWVLSQVIENDAFEPAPWSAVEEQLSSRS